MKKLFCLFIFFLVSLAAHHASAYTSEECIQCHTGETNDSRLKMSLDEFSASIHHQEGIDCQECHSAVIDQDHETMTAPQKVDCTTCHDQENRHGEAADNIVRPQCWSCHTMHGILAKENVLSSVHSTQLKKTCRTCHPRETGKIDYLSFLPSLQIASHNKQDFSMAYNRNNCIGCHQGRAAHGDNSKLDDQNCDTCHVLENGKSALWGAMHPAADLNEQPSIFWAAVLYPFFTILLLCCGVGIYFRKHR